MKWNYALMNPPYSRGQDAIHLQFVEKCLEISNKVVAIFPFGFVTKSNITKQDEYKKKFSDNLESVEQVDSKVFIDTKMPDVAIYNFSDKKTDKIKIVYKDGQEQTFNTLLKTSNFTDYEQNIEHYFKQFEPINTQGLGYLMPINHLKKQGITNETEIKNKKLENAKKCVKNIPDNKVYLICNAFNGGMNAKYFTPKINKIIIDGKDKLIDYVYNINNVSNGYNVMIFDSIKAAENCEAAMKRPLLRFLLYRLQQDQRMLPKRCYKYIPSINWSNDKVKTDEGLLELCGCPKDKCKEYTDYCKKIIDEVDKGNKI